MKAVFYSKYKNEIDDLINFFRRQGIKASIDNHLGYYVAYVEKDKYKEASAIGREHAEGRQVGYINFYDEMRPLFSTSLVYIKLKDYKNVEKGWQYGYDLPRYISNMITSASMITQSPVNLIVNGSDCAIELLSNIDFDKQGDCALKIKELLQKKYDQYIDEIILCSPYGEVLEENIKKEDDDNLMIFYKNSLFYKGIRFPEGKNIVPKSDNEQDYTDSGYYWTSSSYGGKQFSIETDRSDKELVITSSFELFEKKRFTSYWDAERQKLNSISPINSMLVDTIDADVHINVISDNELEIVTKYQLERDYSLDKKLPFNLRVASDKTVRSGMFPFSLENGNYEGEVIEYYIKIANGTRLLHFSDFSTAFEVYDIPSCFDFENNNAALLTDAKIFDEESFDYEDKDIEEIKEYVSPDIKRLINTYKCHN